MEDGGPHLEQSGRGDRLDSVALEKRWEGGERANHADQCQGEMHSRQKAWCRDPGAGVGRGRGFWSHKEPGEPGGAWLQMSPETASEEGADLSGPDRGLWL